MNIDKICKVLNKGGLAITRTDTIYGIMGNALNQKAIKKVYIAKNRPQHKPLILLMNSYEMIKEYTLDLTKKEQEVIKTLMPGPVTIILKKNNKISNLITNNTEYVAIRIPNNQDLLKIITKLNRPIFSTSANLTKEEAITNVNMIEPRLKKYIDYIEDGGEIKNTSSTIIKFNNEKLEILREGELSETLKKMF